MAPLRRRGLLVALSCIGGLLFGALVSILNGASSPILTSASLVFGVGWSWAAVSVLVGALTANRWQAIICGTAALALAVVAYSTSDLIRGVYQDLDQASMRTQTNWQGMLTTTAYWSVLAVVLGPPLSLVGWATRRRSLTGLLCKLVIPAVAATEMAWRITDEIRFQPRSIAVTTWTTTGVIALATTAILIMRFRQQKGRREPSPLRP